MTIVGGLRVNSLQRTLIVKANSASIAVVCLHSEMIRTTKQTSTTHKTYAAVVGLLAGLTAAWLAGLRAAACFSARMGGAGAGAVITELIDVRRESILLERRRTLDTSEPPEVHEATDAADDSMRNGGGATTATGTVGVLASLDLC